MIVVVDDMITIGDFSSRCGLSPRVLRTYAEAGVLVPAAVDPASGYRYYEFAQLDRTPVATSWRRAGRHKPVPCRAVSRRRGRLGAFADSGDLDPTLTDLVGGALGFRNDNGTVTLRIIGVIPAFRHRGIGRRLVERVEPEARRLGAHSVALGTDEAVGFWYHLGYTPNLLFQWIYDADLYEAEVDAMLDGPLSGLHFWRSSFSDVPQLFVELDEPCLDLRHQVREAVTGCHVGFMMSKRFTDRQMTRYRRYAPATPRPQSRGQRAVRHPCPRT